MWFLALAAAFATETAAPAPKPVPPKPIAADRVWEEIAAPKELKGSTPAKPLLDLRASYREAGEKLGDWTIRFAGTTVDGPALIRLADTAPEDPFVRVVREGLARPVDPLDLLYFLDD